MDGDLASNDVGWQWAASWTPPGEVKLEMWGGIPKRYPTHEEWWDWTEFEIFISPGRARLVRKEVPPSDGP